MHTKIQRFWCWLWYGHDLDEQVRTMTQCDRCGAYRS